MPIYTSFLTAGLLVASPVPSDLIGSYQVTHAFSNTETHMVLSFNTQAYNETGDSLHRGSGR